MCLNRVNMVANAEHGFSWPHSIEHASISLHPWAKHAISKRGKKREENKDQGKRDDDRLGGDYLKSVFLILLLIFRFDKHHKL